ncbi:Recombinase [Caloramator mitchellensis]|uniref:Recombinase n=1 Tax=Caloramator mitchellensis TaxID=908809 RepID=A0A0R3K2L2_CALMK|nr:recombinase family protein [Caloramator mitchellensis]KRQ87806.1 Recombinase [Caloramator mitchellensis]
MNVAAIYSRKSKYTGKGESIDNQISIFKDYLERMGISDYLIYEDEGFYSTEFVKMKIKTILNNPAYVKATKEVFDYIESKGITVLLLYNKRKGKGEFKDKSLWVCAVAKHEGIIEAKDWIEVQKSLEKNKEKAPRLGNSKFGLLSGIIRCAKCKSTMKVIYGVLNEKTGEKPHYYSCTMKLNSGKTR